MLATKVSEHPATVAELCWSDDPKYITGYVASKELGYQCITKLKEYGDELKQVCLLEACLFFYDCSSYCQSPQIQQPSFNCKFLLSIVPLNRIKN